MSVHPGVRLVVQLSFISQPVLCTEVWIFQRRLLGVRMTAFEDVSLRALMLLSAAHGSEPLPTRAIAEAVGTPYNHVSKAILRLRELGIIESTRGRAGGVQLSAAGRRATVGGVLRALDRRMDLADCESPNGDCPLNHECGLRGAFRRAREAFYRELDTVPVSSLPHARQMGPILVQIGQRPDASLRDGASEPQGGPALLRVRVGLPAGTRRDLTAPKRLVARARPRFSFSYDSVATYRMVSKP